MLNNYRPPVYTKHTWNKRLELLQMDLLSIRNSLNLFNCPWMTRDQKRWRCQQYLENRETIFLAFYDEDIKVLAALYVMRIIDYDGDHAELFYDALLNAWDYIPDREVEQYKTLDELTKGITLMEYIDSFIPWFKKHYDHQISYEVTLTLIEAIRILMVLHFTENEETNKSSIFYFYMNTQLPPCVLEEDE